MNRKITFCLIITFLLTTFAAADNISVPSGPMPSYPTIELAIAAAGPTDTILVADGNYTPFSPDGYDFGGKDIELKSVNGPQNCIINCNNAGRAFYFHNGETPAASVEGFTIKNGSSYYGGAIECEIDSSPTIYNCIITNNAAVYGGAIDCFYSSPVIENCIITSNTSDFDGGAIECEIESSPVIKNCLIINNTAGIYGGAINCYDTSSPRIKNCTIASNTGDANLGGIYADGTSGPAIKNSILWNNGDDIYGTTDVNYSCIQDGDAGTGNNISTDPIFRRGPYPSDGNYYLSQIDANQLSDSNCINTGDSNAADVFGGSNSSITTRTDNVPDSNIVDMGFHYPAGAEANYVLITLVDPNGNYGTIDPCLPAPGQICKQFAEVRLHAVPDVNCHVVKWTGTDDDNSTDVNNIVTMDANHTVIVKFSSILTYKLTTYALDANGSIDDYNAQPFVQHTVVDINAHPIPGYVVKKWFKGNTATFDINDANIAYDPCSSNPCTLPVAMESDTTVAVQFEPNSIKHWFTPLVVGGLGGHGAIDPNIHARYPEGMIVQLKAIPAYGYKVKQWTG
ncbi:MAG: right-handed parallel beta-helix repeat-containing protein, partial [Sedimentisphaerales bacterium]